MLLEEEMVLLIQVRSLTVLKYSLLTFFQSEIFGS